MTEHIDVAVKNSIYQRAKGQCECEGVGCPHGAQRCGYDLKDYGVAIPEGTPPRDQYEKGRAMCLECFLRTPSYIRQEAWRRPVSV